MEVGRFHVLLLAGLLALGCTGGGGSGKWAEDRPPVYPVSGKVLYNGEPLAGATVAFRPERETEVAFGRTDEQGNFQLTTFEERDGAVAGKHQVRITKKEDVEPPPDYNPETDPALPEPESVIPEKYGRFESSGLSAEVKADQENEFTFELSG